LPTVEVQEGEEEREKQSKAAPRRRIFLACKASVMGSGSDAESRLITVAVLAQLGQQLNGRLDCGRMLFRVM